MAAMGAQSGRKFRPNHQIAAAELAVLSPAVVVAVATTTVVARLIPLLELLMPVLAALNPAAAQPIPGLALTMPAAAVLMPAAAELKPAAAELKPASNHRWLRKDPPKCSLILVAGPERSYKDRNRRPVRGVTLAKLPW